jgi:hypothetical protein
MAHHPDGRTSAASNFLVRLSSVWTMGDELPDGYSSTCNFHISNASVRTMIGSRPDIWSRIGNFLLRCTLVRTTAVRRLDDHIWIAILTLRRRASERETTLSGRLIDLPFLGTWKEIKNWSSTGEASGHAAETSGRMQAGTETSRYSMGSGRNEHFVRMDNAGRSSVRTGWHVVRTNGTVDRWASERDGSIVRTADKELEFLLTCRLWIVESLFTASLHLSDFVQSQNEAKILTDSILGFQSL